MKEEGTEREKREEETEEIRVYHHLEQWPKIGGGKKLQDDGFTTEILGIGDTLSPIIPILKRY